LFDRIYFIVEFLRRWALSEGNAMVSRAMFTVLAVLCAAVSLATVANATDAQDKEFSLKSKELYGACAAGSFVQNYASEAVGAYTTQMSTTPWSGACANGLKEGKGKITIRTRTDYTDARFGPIISEYESSGFFVRGQPAGLNCTDVLNNTDKGKPVQWGMPHYCKLLLGEVYSPFLIKQSENNWRVLPIQSVERYPEIYATANDVEAVSAKLIEQVKSGNLIGPIALRVQIPDAADLVQNGELTLGWSVEPLPLTSKRVAIVLTSNTEKEFARFDTMRHGFFSKTAGVKDLWGHRKDYMARSDPKNMLMNISTAFAEKAASVLSAGDFSVLGDGGADYVALVDWRFKGNFDLSKSQLQGLPVCGDGGDDSQCPPFYDDDLSIFVINKDLHIVRALSTSAGRVERSSYPDTKSSLDELFDQMYTRTFAWDKESGTVREAVKNWLERGY